MRRAALLLVLAAPLALAACGSGHKAAGPQQMHLDPAAYVRHAAHKTAAATSEHMAMTGTATAVGMKITLRGSGDFDNAKQLGSMHASFSAGGLDGSIDEILSGTDIYLRSPLFTSQLPAGKTWMKLDLQKFGKSQGLDFSALMSQSPTQALQRLEASGTVTRVGTETIDGTATTHFRVENVDLSKIPAGTKIEALTHAKYGPFDVWIGDRDGYVYRETFSVSYSTGGQDGSMSTTMDFSRFGEPVHVTVPPSAKTLDATTAAMGGLGA